MPGNEVRDCAFAAVVLGAGPAGSAAAAELARRGLPVALIGRNDQRASIGECLPPGIRPQLEKAGVWQEFLCAGHTPSAGICSLWGSPAPSYRDFLLSPYGKGWHIDRSRFDAMMRDSAIHCGAKWLDCLAVRHVERLSSGWRIQLSAEPGDFFVDTRLVMDATGRSSVFARRAGAKRISLDRLAGAAGYFSCRNVSSVVEPVLLVEAVENGWWYTAPLPEGKLVAVFMTDSDFIQQEKLTQKAPWMAQLASAVEQKQRIEGHGFELEGAIRIVPAESSFLDRIAGDGWLAAGDAAAAFDPLSSQGIIAAVSSGLEAARTAFAWLGGDENAPVAYAERVRKGYAEYLAHRGIYYGIEQRWSESSFWKMRHAPSSILAAKKEAVCV